ncbi:MAG: glycosyltransferase family 39 protein [Actinomycetota bacterium]|nr:glycosyltransferase family 39 protein [Actinomycetota bacterium]
MDEERVNESISREGGERKKGAASSPAVRTARLWGRVKDGVVSRRDKWPWLLAILGVFVAALLWRWHFASQAKIYTYDSYYYMVLGRNLREGLHYSVAGHAHFKFMPLYPISIAFLNLFIPNLEFVGKFSNVLFASLCVFPIYTIGTMLFGRRSGLAAAGLFAFEPISTAWSGAPMSDGLFTLLVCLSAFWFLKWIKNDEAGNRCLYLSAGTAGLTVVTRWEGALFLIFLGLYLLYCWWKRRLSFANVAIFAGIALAPFILLMIRNLIAFGTPIKSAYLSELGAHPEEFETIGPLGRLWRYMFFSDVPPIGISRNFYHYGYLLFGYSGLLMTLVLRRYRRYGLFLCLWLFFMGPLHFMWYFASVRFLFAAIPPLCLGAGALIGLSWVEPARDRRGYVVSFFMILIVVCLVGVLALTGRPMTNDIFHHGILSLEDDVGGLAARDAVTWLKDNAGDEAVATSLGPMVSFYLGRDAYFLGEWQGFEPADVRIENLVEDNRELGVEYIVLWSWEPDEEAPLEYLGLDASMLQELELVDVWVAPPSNEWNRAVYAWIFEIPRE